MKRRIFIHHTHDQFLSANHLLLKSAIITRIQQEGFIPEVFFNVNNPESLAAREAWSPQRADFVARRCDGAVIIGMPRWTFSSQGSQVLMASEYAQYEGALIHTLGLPLFIIAQEDLLHRGVFSYGFGKMITEFPSTADEKWLDSSNFTNALNMWLQQVRERRDVFLGYCSSSAEVAERLKDSIINKIGATVLDWRTDFGPGPNVLSQISDAAARCKGGLFLFTRDDQIAEKTNSSIWRRGKPNAADQAIPRDNVVFEAGYFIESERPGACGDIARKWHENAR